MDISSLFPFSLCHYKYLLGYLYMALQSSLYQPSTFLHSCIVLCKLIVLPISDTLWSVVFMGGRENSTYTMFLKGLWQVCAFYVNCDSLVHGHFKIGNHWSSLKVDEKHKLHYMIHHPILHCVSFLLIRHVFKNARYKNIYKHVIV